MGSSEFVERFRLGDHSAVGELYRSHGRLVFAVSLRMLGDRGLAEEATQQTFVQAWRAAASFDGERDLGPWLATIARRVAIDIHRREARRPAGALSDVPADDPSVVTLPPDVEQVFDAWQVRAAVDALPPDEREIVRLQHLDGFTHTEIAEQLGIPVGTVKSRSYRAHRLLAGRLGHLREVPEP